MSSCAWSQRRRVEPTAPTFQVVQLRYQSGSRSSPIVPDPPAGTATERPTDRPRYPPHGLGWRLSYAADLHRFPSHRPTPSRIGGSVVTDVRVQPVTTITATGGQPATPTTDYRWTTGYRYTTGVADHSYQRSTGDTDHRLPGDNRCRRSLLPVDNRLPLDTRLPVDSRCRRSTLTVDNRCRRSPLTVDNR